MTEEIAARTKLIRALMAAIRQGLTLEDIKRILKLRVKRDGTGTGERNRTVFLTITNPGHNFFYPGWNYPSQDV